MYVQSAFKCSAQCIHTGESKSEGENNSRYSKYSD